MTIRNKGKEYYEGTVPSTAELRKSGIPEHREAWANRDCAMCGKKLKVGEKYILYGKDQVLFHKDCFPAFARQHDSCPNCGTSRPHSNSMSLRTCKCGCRW